MSSRSRAVALLLFALPAIGSTTSVAKTAMIPPRILTCTLGRVVNFDPHANQSPADLRYDGRHAFTLALPAIPVRTTEPPDPVDPPEPVNPATRIIADPDNLVGDAPPHFDRVVDLWPDRVELTTTIASPLVNLIIVHPIDPVHGTANLFMTHATDLTGFDLAHLYQGACVVKID